MLAGADRPGTRTVPTAQQQRETVQRLMEASLAAQRASVARQTGPAPGGSFFLLPRTEAPALPDADCARLDPDKAASLIEDAAKRSALDPGFLRSVARQESGFHPCAVSSKGAMGLMQLMPSTARELGVTNPFDPAQSVDAGARLLRKYLDTYGSLPLALGAYNAGPARVNEAGEVPKIRETLDYVRNILSTMGNK